MTPEERLPLLDALARLAYQDAESVDPLVTFLPLYAHRRALSEDVVIVLGSRGSGKTALFKLVNDLRTAPRLRAFFATDQIPEATWIDAFSQTGDHHPDVGTLEQRAKEAGDLTLRAFWMAHLLRRVNETIADIVKVPPALEVVLSAPAADLAAWLPVAEANLGAINAALDASNRALQATGRTVVATYDNLDRLGQFDLTIRRRYISTLLALWLSLTSRYQNLRGKIFLRDDLFDAGELGFADATKLRPRSESLVWDAAALYRVAVRHLAHSSEPMRAWLQTIPGLTLQDRGEFGWMPGEMPDEVQYAFGGRLAGKVIGKGAIKGYTSKWIIGRLQDANKRITPRSMLWFLGFAGKSAQAQKSGRRATLVSPNDLLVALRQASRERIQEIREEYELMARFENLRGMTIPLDRGEVINRLGKAQPGEPAGIPLQGELVFNELCRIGVLRPQDDAHVDVPDIYRYSLQITPDYATAWKNFIAGDDRPTQDTFLRELPILGALLREGGIHSSIPGAEDDMKRGDFAAARVKYERALDVFKSAGDALRCTEIMERLGALSINQQRFDRAEDEFSAAAEGYRKSGKIEQEIRCLAFLGFVTFRADPTKASLSSLRALKMAQQKNATIGETISFLVLAVSAETLKRQDYAIMFIVIAVNIIEQLAGKQQIDKLATSIKGLAQAIGIATGDIEAHREEARGIYKRDRGWSLVHAAFPGILPAE